MKTSVASITVSYNGKGLLGRHIESLQAQSRAIDQIIVVDNGSSDGTSEFLATSFPQVKAVRLNVNAGTAGGWAAGLRYAAIEHGFDWIWTFDDDSEPPANALEMLLESFQQIPDNGDVGILSPVPVHPASGQRYFPLLLRRGRPAPPPVSFADQRIWFADMVITSGCMVRREVVQGIGLPLADFYMDFFDFEYSLRARQAGYRIAVVAGCEMKHEIGTMKAVSVLGMKRNTGLQPAWRRYYIARNMVYTACYLSDRKLTRLGSAGVLLRNALGVLLMSEHKVEDLFKMAQGAWDGARGKLGIRFQPKSYSR